MNERLKISIANVYPELLSVFGDLGNSVILQNRCIWRGIDVELNSVSSNEKLPQSDIYLIGGGQDNSRKQISQMLNEQKEFWVNQVDKGAVILTIDSSFELFGKYYKDENEQIDGLGIFDAYTIKNKTRFSGNVTAKTDFLNPKTLVGFENHAGTTFLQGCTKPLATTIIGNGNNGKDKTEGARVKNVFGTYLHGTILAQNIHFADYLIKLALQNKYGENVNLEPLSDNFEIETHNLLVNKSY